MVEDDTTTAWEMLGFDTVEDVKDPSDIVVKTEQQAELVDF